MDKSRIATRNRCSETGGLGTGPSKHTGGSRSTVEHTIKLAAELRRPPNSWDIFKKLHKRKDGSFVDAKSKCISVGCVCCFSLTKHCRTYPYFVKLLKKKKVDFMQLCVLLLRRFAIIVCVAIEQIFGAALCAVFGSDLSSFFIIVMIRCSQGLALYQDQNSVTSRNLYAVSDDVAEERIKLLEEEVLHMRENQERILQERLEAEVQQRVEHEVSRLRQQSDDRFKSMEERWSRMMSEMALSSRSSSNPSP
ncbi:uncharacterized protein [Solanum tuberosum]|uniref:uncharacterized protein n=1 Tax=Solanum tuberosum TaxID=4113 RepID=UPI00073A190B|nr:PREDICTED: uncharacterized protein LOC102581951 [Solanum tuberosum]